MRFSGKITACAITFFCLFILINAVCAAKTDTGPLDLIRKGLNSEDLEVKILALNMLGELKDQGSANNIKSLLKDSNKSVQIRAAVALHKLGDNEGVEEIVKILVTKPEVSDKPNPLERMKAVAAERG
jgi:HEAT repeat protein